VVQKTVVSATTTANSSGAAADSGRHQAHRYEDQADHQPEHEPKGDQTQSDDQPPRQPLLPALQSFYAVPRRSLHLRCGRTRRNDGLIRRYRRWPCPLRRVPTAQRSEHVRVWMPSCRCLHSGPFPSPPSIPSSHEAPPSCVRLRLPAFPALARWGPKVRRR